MVNKLPYQAVYFLIYSQFWQEQRSVFATTDCRVIPVFSLAEPAEIVSLLQVKREAAGLYDGAEVVLGPDSGLEKPGPEQQFINQKMRPGSGVLSVQVLPDGPTRVLQVSTEPSQDSASCSVCRYLESL